MKKRDKKRLATILTAAMIHFGPPGYDAIDEPLEEEFDEVAESLLKRYGLSLKDFNGVEPTTDALIEKYL